jgi:hypothetical protein
MIEMLTCDCLSSACMSGLQDGECCAKGLKVCIALSVLVSTLARKQARKSPSFQGLPGMQGLSILVAAAG